MDPCDAYEERLFWLSQDALDPDERPEVEAHKESCDACRGAFEEFAATATLLEQEPAPPAWSEQQLLAWSTSFRGRLEALERPRVARPPRFLGRHMLLAAALVCLCLGTAFGVAIERARWPSAERARAVTAYLSLADHYYLEEKNFDEAFVYYGLALELENVADDASAEALELARRRLVLIDEVDGNYALLKAVAEGERALAEGDVERARKVFVNVTARAPDNPVAWWAVELSGKLLVSEALSAAAAPKTDVAALKAELRSLLPRGETSQEDLEPRLENLRNLRNSSNHSMAAYAQLTIAELLRRAGRDEDAIDAYTVVLKEFADVEPAVALARRRLAEAGPR